MMFSEKENSGKGGLGGHANNQPRVAIGSPVVYKCSPVTNADRLRAKSDEEMAEFIANVIDCCNCKHPRNGCSENDETCAACWLDWLKLEANCE